MPDADSDFISLSQISRWPGAEDSGGACPDPCFTTHPRACLSSAWRWETGRSCFLHVLLGNWLAPESVCKSEKDSVFTSSWRALFTVWIVPSQTKRRLLTSSRWASLWAMLQCIHLGRVLLDCSFQIHLQAAQPLWYACGPCMSLKGRKKGWGDRWRKRGSRDQALLLPPPSTFTPMSVLASFLSYSLFLAGIWLRSSSSLASTDCQPSVDDVAWCWWHRGGIAWMLAMVQGKERKIRSR